MSATSKNPKQIYLEMLKDLDINANKPLNLRRMEKRLHEEFDAVWVKYNNGKATIVEGEKALNDWLEVNKL